MAMKARNERLGRYGTEVSAPRSDPYTQFSTRLLLEGENPGQEFVRGLGSAFFPTPRAVKSQIAQLLGTAFGIPQAWDANREALDQLVPAVPRLPGAVREMAQDPRGLGMLLGALPPGMFGSRRVRSGERLRGGYQVGEYIPDLGSISASGLEELAGGPRAVPMALFQAAPRQMFYAADDLRRVENLAGQIRNSGRIDPLIFGVDEHGPYILEGAHRAAAMHTLGADELPGIFAAEPGVYREASTRMRRATPRKDRSPR